MHSRVGRRSQERREGQERFTKAIVMETENCCACLTACSLARVLARCLEVLELHEVCCMRLASPPSCRTRLQQPWGAGQVSMLRDLWARAVLPPGRRLPSIQVSFSLKFLFFVLTSCPLSSSHRSVQKDELCLMLPAGKPDGTEALLSVWLIALDLGVV